MVEYRFFEREGIASYGTYRGAAIFSVDRDTDEIRTFDEVTIPEFRVGKPYSQTTLNYVKCTSYERLKEYGKSVMDMLNAAEASERNNAAKQIDPIRAACDALDDCGKHGNPAEHIDPIRATCDALDAYDKRCGNAVEHVDPVRAACDALNTYGGHANGKPRNQSKSSYSVGEIVLNGLTPEQWSKVIYSDSDKHIDWTGKLKITYDTVLKRWRAFIDLNAVETAAEYNAMVAYVKDVLPALEKRRQYVNETNMS